MSDPINIKYTLIDISIEIYNISLSKEATCQEVIDMINSKHDNTYSFLFYEKTKVSQDSIINDLWKSNEDSIFIATKLDIPSDKLDSSLSYINLCFYFTGGDGDMLLNGIPINLRMNLNPSQCQKELLNFLEGKIDTKGKKITVYLSIGFPFIAGTLKDFYLNEDLNPSKNIYGVISIEIPDEKLNESFIGRCNLSDPMHKLLMSPLCESTTRGLCDIACLLTYFSYEKGSNTEKFNNKTSGLIHFPPFSISLQKIIENEYITCNDIVNVCSTLFTFFKIFLNSKIEDLYVFEYGLRICNLIVDVCEDFISSGISVYESNDASTLPPGLKTIKYVVWKPGIDNGFYTPAPINDITFDKIEKSYELFSSFTPVPPFSIRHDLGCSFIKGENHNYLFMMNTPIKNQTKNNLITIFDPMIGQIESVDLESFAKSQQHEDDDDSFIDPSDVKQIIMIDVDVSMSMKYDINGKNNMNREVNRLTIAFQCITSLINRMQACNIQSFLSLVSFGSQVLLRHPFTFFCHDIENAFKEISPSGKTKLWDAIALNINEIHKFKKDVFGNEIYKNAISRIIVFSDGQDRGSSFKITKVVKELIMNKIIVDGFAITNNEEECKALCAVCHLTGGFAFLFNDFQHFFSIFENIQILNYEERLKHYKPLIPNDKSSIPFKIKPEKITEEFMDNLIESSVYDDFDLENFRVFQQNQLSTINHILSIDNKRHENSRNKRILSELYDVALRKVDESSQFDPEIQVFLYKSNIDKWRVFIKGDGDYIYKNKWWELSVSFPDLYPSQPPSFRFVTVPYHINVSSDGQICLDILNENYKAWMKVVNLIQEIKRIFIFEDLYSSFRLDACLEYYFDNQEYRRLAMESSDKYAKNDYKEYLSACSVDDDVSPDLNIKKSTEVPIHNISQFNCKKIPEKSLILASSRVYYDKKELKEYLKSYQHPICIITGKELTDKAENISIEYKYV
ncbi:hypothetical protein M9Y10_001600 [Tritrichomonas musculus]|uniref:UBC core domain-containing protein n=1 Tax=Tritrichomonas musculus TaxID=1915356 RepID=A0ABR2GM14_9EUKA